MRQGTGQPRLVASTATEAMGKHHQWMLADRRWRIAHGWGADEYGVIGDQLGRGGDGAGVPDDHLQWAVVAWVCQRGGLEADGVIAGKCRGGCTDQKQSAEGCFQWIFLDWANCESVGI